MVVERSTLLFWVNILLFIDSLIVAFSGFILKFVYLAGEKSGKAGIIFILDRFGWLTFHYWAAVLLVLLVIIHLVLNWRWIKGMFGNSFGK